MLLDTLIPITECQWFILVENVRTVSHTPSFDVTSMNPSDDKDTF